MPIKHHKFDTNKLVDILNDISATVASGKVPLDWPLIDAQMAHEIMADPRNAAIVTVFISSVRRTMSQIELEMINAGALAKVQHGFGLFPSFMDFVQIGYNLALRELGLDDTRSVSNGTRPLQA